MLEAGGQREQAVPGVAVAVWQEGQIVWSHAAGAASFAGDGLTPLRPLTPQSAVRAASMSKLATALTAYSLARDGLVDMDADVTATLGFELPVQPGGAPVTLTSLLAHTSGICDPDIYWAPQGETLEALLTEAARCPYPPGRGWTYANINYAIAAQVMEIATQVRFDRLASARVIEPLGLDAGFNWSGVSASTRRDGATLYRFSDGRWLAQIDDAQTLNDTRPAILRRADQGDDVSAGQTPPPPFTNGTLYSPQGGLRASVEDLAILASSFLPGHGGAALAEPVWTGDERPGVRAYGPGPQILQPGQIASHREWRFVGHAGEAYGLYGGAWAIPARNAAVAFFVTGVDPDADLSRDPVSGFTRYEAELMSIALQALESHSTPH
jgi:CubicO group peptidase (beta-lactamase class C family)